MAPAEVMHMFATHIGVPVEMVDDYMAGDPFNIPLATKYIEDYTIAINGMGICDREDVLRAFPVDVVAETFSTATGIDMSAEEMLESAERVWTLEKCFNVREGWTRADDDAPRRTYKEPLVTINGTYPPLTQEYVDGLLDAYYEAHDWDAQTGIPTRKRMEELGLGTVADDLQREGKLAPV